MSRPPAVISVAIATRDRPHVLGHVLDAIKAGEVRPPEIVVVDQSVDGRSEQIVRERGSAGLEIRYVRDDRTGLGVAQNVAFSYSRSPIVAVTDDDCVPDARWLCAIASAFTADSEVGAVTGPVVPLASADLDLVPVSSRTSLHLRTFSGRHAPWEVGSGNNFAVRREWLDAIGGNDERLGPGAPGQGAADMDLFYRLLRAGARIRYDPDCLVHHEQVTRADRLARRGPYGHGIGAAVTLWLREGDLYALVVLAKWLSLRLRRLLGGFVRRDWTLAHEEAVVLSGTARGLIFGLGLRGARPTGLQAASHPPP